MLVSHQYRDRQFLQALLLLLQEWAPLVSITSIVAQLTPLQLMLHPDFRMLLVPLLLHSPKLQKTLFPDLSAWAGQHTLNTASSNIHSNSSWRLLSALILPRPPHHPSLPRRTPPLLHLAPLPQRPPQPRLKLNGVTATTCLSPLLPHSTQQNPHEMLQTELACCRPSTRSHLPIRMPHRRPRGLQEPHSNPVHPSWAQTPHIKASKAPPVVIPHRV